MYDSLGESGARVSTWASSKSDWTRRTERPVGVSKSNEGFHGSSALRSHLRRDHLLRCFVWTSKSGEGFGPSCYRGPALDGAGCGFKGVNGDFCVAKGIFDAILERAEAQRD